MCCRFQIGSNSPFANRNARMLSTDSLPRKWSILKTRDSSKTECTTSFSFRADSRSSPNGFSMITFASPLFRPQAPSSVITVLNADGGTAKWNSRPTWPPIADSAAWTADTSGDVSSVDAAPNDSRDANWSHSGPVGFDVPNWSMAAFACAAKSSSAHSNCRGEVPMMRNFSGSSPATNRWYSPGSSLRLARSPVAPNST